MESDGIFHAFHIHINSFLMTQRFGVDITSACIWRDTVRLDASASAAPPPPNSTIFVNDPVTVKFVSRQLDYTGDFVLHCHVLNHEDTGMMLNVQITQ